MGSEETEASGCGFCGKDEGVGNDLGERPHFDAELVGTVQLHELVDAVVAGRRDYLGARRPDLVGLDPPPQQ